LEGDPASVDFADLQARLSAVAPEMAETAWGHKYFSLMAPALIEPFHGADYQKHQLIKMLKMPGDGRYENARILVGVAALVNHLPDGNGGRSQVADKRVVS